MERNKPKILGENCWDMEIMFKDNFHVEMKKQFACSKQYFWTLFPFVWAAAHCK